MARPYFDKYIDIYGAARPGFKDSMSTYNRIAREALRVGYGGNLNRAPADFRALYTQATKIYGGNYDLAEYERLIAPHTYDIWYNSGGKTQVDQWHQSDLAEEKKKHDQALQQQQQEIQKIKDQQAEVDRKRQEAAAAAEKSRKEQEFKSALDAMNQRTMKRSVVEEDLGAVAVDPQDSAKKKKRRVGYDATKSTGVLGIPQTERKQLLGM